MPGSLSSKNFPNEKTREALEPRYQRLLQPGGATIGTVGEKLYIVHTTMYVAYAENIAAAASLDGHMLPTAPPSKRLHRGKSATPQGYQ